jgi:hypothetical protein
MTRTYAFHNPRDWFRRKKMFCSLRNLFLLVIILTVTASLGLAQTTRIQQDDPSITYSGIWYQNAGASNSGGSAALTNATGARAVVTFTGTGISWISEGDPWNGLATVTLDGQQRKIDGWASTTRYQAVLFTVSGLPAGPHKLSLEINHERGPNGLGSWVWVDAFDIEQGTGLVGGVPPATTGRIENDNPAVTYTGLWYPNTSPLLSGGTAVLAVNPGSAVSLTFNGTSIAWIAYRDQWSGMANVILDGQLVGTIDTFLSPEQAQTVAYKVGGLTSGNHSLTIAILGTHNPLSGGSWVWLDAFDVGQTTPPQIQIPVLSINATAFCVGAAWSVGVTNAVAGTSVSLAGTSDGLSWGVPQWATTDANGNSTQNGSFAKGTQGAYTLTVGIGGKTSNTIFFVVSNCAP